MRKFLVGVAVFVVVIGLAAAWFVGPMLGMALRGKPFFLVTTPERYAGFAFNYAHNGLYADSPQFREALGRAQAELENVDSVEQTYPLIDAVLTAAGGKHSGFVSPERSAEFKSSAQAMPEPARQGDVVVVVLPGFAGGAAGQE